LSNRVIKGCFAVAFIVALTHIASAQPPITIYLAIDMQQKSESALRRYGAEESRKLFLQLKPGENPNYPNGIEDNTHFNPVGAEAMAQLAVEGIKELKIELTRYLKP
jgi:lysophospholipase L1-like esterase